MRTVKSISVVSDHYLTPTEKRHIKYMLENELPCAKINGIKSYWLKDEGNSTINVTIETPDKTDYGKPIVRTSYPTISVLYKVN